MEVKLKINLKKECKLENLLKINYSKESINFLKKIIDNYEKIIVFGATNVGKTTLIKTIKEKEFCEIRSAADLARFKKSNFKFATSFFCEENINKMKNMSKVGAFIIKMNNGTYSIESLDSIKK